MDQEGKGTAPLAKTEIATSQEAGERPRADAPLVWLITGKRTGDNNQLLTLATALGWPFETKDIAYNSLRWIAPLRTGLTIVTGKTRHLLRPPWPDLVLCVGYGSVTVARYIRQQTGGRARLVHIGNPRDRVEDFDLQITTPQYARHARNLLQLPFPIGNPAKYLQPRKEEIKWLGDFPRPCRLIAVGGPARHWQVDHTELLRTIDVLTAKHGGSLIVATSQRTTKSTRRLLDARVPGRGTIVDQFPRFGVLLAQCDEIHVTADSVSMLSEAILTGKPVGMIPIKRSLRGVLSHWTYERLMGRNTLPDFPNFWRLLQENRLVGTVEHPLATQVSDTVEIAAKAVRELLSEDAIGQSNS